MNPLTPTPKKNITSENFKPTAIQKQFVSALIDFLLLEGSYEIQRVYMHWRMIRDMQNLKTKIPKLATVERWFKNLTFVSWLWRTVEIGLREGIPLSVRVLAVKRKLFERAMHGDTRSAELFLRAEGIIEGNKLVINDNRQQTINISAQELALIQKQLIMERALDFDTNGESVDVDATGV